MYIVWDYPVMRPLCYDQPETLTQGYYPHVDSVAMNAALRRIGE